MIRRQSVVIVFDILMCVVQLCLGRVVFSLANSYLNPRRVWHLILRHGLLFRIRCSTDVTEYGVTL